MEHAEAEERLAAYALGALEAGEAQAVERHLPACPACREELARSSEVADLLPDALAEVSPLRVHPELDRRVLAYNRPSPQQPKPFRLAPWWVAAAPLLLLCLASTIWVVL